MSIAEKQKQLVEEFEQIQDWEDRYGLIIKMGKELSEMDSTLKVDDNKVQGCQSQVWIHAKLDEQGCVVFQADSDAMIVRGLVAVLLKVYSGNPPQEILAQPPEFIKQLGFEGNLSPNRANGLYAMIRQIQYYATAFAALLAARG